MEAFIKSIQLGRNIQRFRVSQLRPFAKGFSILMAYWVIENQLQKYKDNQELLLKKERLSMPVYELSEEDYLSPPWSGDNYEQWKYRLVKISGRQIHRHTMFIPRKIHNYQGFDYIVPVVHSESANFENQVGLLVNKGYIPHEYKDVTNRFRVEDAYNQFEFIGMVNKGEDLKNKNIFRKGNVVDEQRWIWNDLFLPQMAKASSFKNRKAVEQGIIEVLDLKETDLDEKNPHYYNKNMSGTTTFPFPKTLSGALQPSISHNKLFKDQLIYTFLAVIGFIY